MGCPRPRPYRRSPAVRTPFATVPLPTRGRSHRARRRPPLIDALEARVLCDAAPTGMTPAQIRHAYGFDKIAADGTGQTIAIVTAFDAPTIAADLDVFDQTFSFAAGGPDLFTEYGAASTFFTKHAMAGRTPVKVDAGWAQEAALDVQWAHAIAPGAKILLVEAASDAMADLMAGVNYARAQAAVSVISMSWGGDEFSYQKQYDAMFTTPATHRGITFVASSGDEGAVSSYPAVSPNVLAVGGTSLYLDPEGNYLDESAWSDSGGGYSAYEKAPAFQSGLTRQTRRSSPDVAYNANPYTGFPVYDSLEYEGDAGWLTFGGTSAGTPQWAGLIALANQLRAAAGKAPLDGPTQALPAIYAAPASNFHDVTYGITGYHVSAAAGYDLATGRGSPVADLLVATLASVPAKSGPAKRPTASPRVVILPDTTQRPPVATAQFGQAAPPAPAPVIWPDPYLPVGLAAGAKAAGVKAPRVGWVAAPTLQKLVMPAPIAPDFRPLASIL